MYKPSGIAVVTAGLAALALFHVVWGRDTRPAEPWLQQDAPTPRGAFDPGTTFQLHSGAWRAWSAPVEEEPTRVPVALPAPDVPADVAPQVVVVPDQGAPSQQTGEPAGFTAFAQPAAPPEAKTPTTALPLAEGRMALAGPEAETAPPPATQTGRSAPRTHDRASEAQAPAPSESKFGPTVFRQIERNGP